MSFVTKSQLRDLARSGPAFSERIAKSLADNPDLFLSHSKHEDDAHIAGAVQLLEMAGASVYVDIADEQLAGMNTQQKTLRLREAVRRCGRLVVIFSEHTASSRWIPWELGLADGTSGALKVATLPMSDLSGDYAWGQQEYFGVYPQIQYKKLKTTASQIYAVRNPASGGYWRLGQWLNL